MLFFFHEISFSFQFCCRRLDAQKIAHYFLSLSNLEHFPADVPLWHLFLCGYFIVRLFLYECHVSLCSTKGLCPLSSNFFFFYPWRKCVQKPSWASAIGRLSRRELCVCMARRINIYLSLSFQPMERTENKGLLGSTVRCWTIDLDWWLSFSHCQKDSLHLVDCILKACRL